MFLKRVPMTHGSVQLPTGAELSDNPTMAEDESVDRLTAALFYPD